MDGSPFPTMKREMENLPKRKSTRLKEFDYSQFGYYFITICIKNRREFFSNIVGTNLVLTKFGNIVDEIWQNLPEYYNVELDNYVIMPDHFRGIIIIDNYPDVGDRSNKKYHNLSEIIGKFKSYTTRKIKECLIEKKNFEWQKSFYDRIIRDENELYQIRKYIEENPLSWDIDRNNPKNIEM